MDYTRKHAKIINSLSNPSMDHQFWIEEVTQTGAGEGLLRLEDAGRLAMRCGQYCLAWRGGDQEILPVVVFASLDGHGNPVLTGDLPESWLPGRQLHLRGPLGHGFDLPKNTRRAGFLSAGVTLTRLLPLVVAAVEQGAEVVCWGDSAGFRLPAEVEILPASQSGALWDWADYLALDGMYDSLAQLALAEWKNRPMRSTLKVEALVRTPLACGGIAECGVCALPIRRSWALGCKEGPVFDFSRLEF